VVASLQTLNWYKNRSLSLKTELAISIFSSNTDAKTLDQELYTTNIQRMLNAVAPFSLINQETRIGHAAEAELRYKPNKKIGLDITAEKVSRGFRSLAVQNQAVGYLDVGVKGRAQLFKGRVRLQAKLGGREGNISRTMSQTPQRAYCDLNTQLVLFGMVNVDASYSRFEIQTRFQDSTVRQEQGSNGFSLNPSFSFGNRIIHTGAFNLNLESNQENDVWMGKRYLMPNESFGLQYSMQSLQNWSVTATLQMFSLSGDGRQIGPLNTQQWNATLSLHQKLMKGKLDLMSQIRYLGATSTADSLRRVVSFSSSSLFKPIKSLGFGLKVNGQLQGIEQGQLLATKVQFNVCPSITYNF
jgi:hypothetical protein